MRVFALSPALLLAASAVLFGAAWDSAAAQGGTHTVSGVVRGSVNDEPLGGALIDLHAGANSRSARSDQFGAFEVNSVAPGTYRMTVRRIGYAELARELIVADRDTALTVALVPRAMTLDTMRVKANVIAIYGVVGTSLTLMPLEGAKVLVVGAGRPRRPIPAAASSSRSRGRARISCASQGLATRACCSRSMFRRSAQSRRRRCWIRVAPLSGRTPRNSGRISTSASSGMP